MTLMVMHGAGKLRTLLMFPSIFQGKHTRYAKHVALHRGREITVEFDRPAPLQIDGETIPDVSSYTAAACRPVHTGRV